MHVIIAGAGPCGLLLALQLQRAGIQATILERAAEDKLLADVGSGYDLSPSTTKLLRELGFGHHFGTTFQSYNALYVTSNDGTVLRKGLIPQLVRSGGDGGALFMAKRSDLQRIFLEALRREAARQNPETPTPATLWCGVEVLSWREDGSGGVTVEYQPRGGHGEASIVTGDALLGCDGIHSAVRRGMNAGSDDSMSFCGAVTWWGKSVIAPGSELELEAAASQAPGNAFVMTVGSAGQPGSLIGGVVVDGDPNSAEGKKMIWALTMAPSPEVTDLILGKVGDDLTRRGGIVGKEAKAMAVDSVDRYGSTLVKRVVAAAEESNVTLVGLFDRKDLSKPWVSPGGLVALLGDAGEVHSDTSGNRNSQS
mmetsp:Transcript_8861/g.25548  ORF Transcript_8861/g.25548 Transcript_8861/m.25548 type:complete len:367 (+) Transcript_8861:312-1412(+)